MVGLGVGLENRRMSGENEVLPKNLEADVPYGDGCLKVLIWTP
jgi:hypothetical protein